MSNCSPPSPPLVGAAHDAMGRKRRAGMYSKLSPPPQPRRLAITPDPLEPPAAAVPSRIFHARAQLHDLAAGFPSERDRPQTYLAATCGLSADTAAARSPMARYWLHT